MSQIQEFEKVSIRARPLSPISTSIVRRSSAAALPALQPAMVPLIVLLVLIVFFGITKGERFFSFYTITLIMQQVAVVAFSPQRRRSSS